MRRVTRLHAPHTSSRIGTRYIEVFETLEDDFVQAKRRAVTHASDAGLPSSSSYTSHDSGAVLRLRGLPYGAHVADVQEFMAAWPLQQARAQRVLRAAAVGISFFLRKDLKC